MTDAVEFATATARREEAESRRGAKALQELLAWKRRTVVQLTEKGDKE